jgi:hypothetical protein
MGLPKQFHGANSLGWDSVAEGFMRSIIIPKQELSMRFAKYFCRMKNCKQHLSGFQHIDWCQWLAEEV